MTKNHIHSTYVPPVVDSMKSYENLYQESIVNPDGFWREHGRIIDWQVPYQKIKKVSFDEYRVDINWFYDGQTNAAYNCIDRHLPDHAERIAIMWEPDEPGAGRQMTYKELHEAVSLFANGLKGQGVRQGDVVTIYMPMIIEVVVAMLACARIGAVHCVIFGGFSPEALASRLLDSGSKIIVTADSSSRAGKTIQLKKQVDQAIIDHQLESQVQRVIVYEHSKCVINWFDDRDISWDKIVDVSSKYCPIRIMPSEAPLFTLYTSGSTGKPKGMLHTTGGYLVYTALTFKTIFQYQSGDVFWSTADVGWITGHSYLVYGPLLNGATIVLHEGTPNYPTMNRLAQIIDKYQVNILYTAPTAIRTLMTYGNLSVEHTKRSSLKVLGTVGEPINPNVWQWYANTIGNSNCPVVDTWWQTETGGMMIAPIANVIPTKPGSATLPFFGVQPALVDDHGKLITGAGEGNLVLMDSWPGQARTIFKNHDKFVQTYFTPFKGFYCSGDGAKRDEDGYYWITGRIDDVLNISGHRLGTAELESAAVAHPDVVEAAVVGVNHSLKGQAIGIFVILRVGYIADHEVFHKDLKQWIRDEIGAIAIPDYIYCVTELPKTRSGKIMRRILRMLLSGESEKIGDVSTLNDTGLIEKLKQEIKPVVA